MARRSSNSLSPCPRSPLARASAERRLEEAKRLHGLVMAGVLGAGRFLALLYSLRVSFDGAAAAAENGALVFETLESRGAL